MNDILMRLALNEAATPEEARIYETIRALCRDREDVDGLFLLITAVNDVAVARGFKLNLSLNRKPQKVPRKHNGDFHETLKGIWPSVYGLPPKESEPERGPIERYLRSDTDHCTDKTHRVYAGAFDNLQRQGCKDPDWEDVMSEAIEAAVALGL